MKIWIKEFFNKIISSNDQPYLDRIKELEGLYNDELNKYSQLEKQLETEQKLKNKYLEDLDRLQLEYDKLQAITHQEAEYTIPTDIIDPNTFAYLPNTIYWYWDGQKPASKTVAVQVHKFYRNWDDNMFNYFRSKLNNKTTYRDKFIALRDACYDKITYKHDLGAGLKQGENWKMPSEIFYSGIDDCDGFTTLFVTACHICDIPADRVFNATGYYHHITGWVGHSYPVVKFDDNKWYVLEGTAKRQPLLFKDNTEYKIPNNLLNGLSNWAMSGKSKKETF